MILVVLEVVLVVLGMVLVVPSAGHFRCSKVSSKIGNPGGGSGGPGDGSGGPWGSLETLLGGPRRSFRLLGGLGEVCFWPVRTYVRSTYPLVCGPTFAHSHLGA